jgi:hypothetical protein
VALAEQHAPSGDTVSPKAREHRYRRLKEMGCIACRLEGERLAQCGPTEIHHLNEGGKAGQKRRGDEFTIALGKWHHQGVSVGNATNAGMARLFGPSLAKQSREFRKRYGSDDELLAKTDQRIAEMDAVAYGHLSEAEVSS